MKKWMRVVTGIVIGCCVFWINGHAFSPEATEGKQKFQLCNACHNPSLDPPLAPPMWGVQRRYKRIAQDKNQFIDMVAQFAKAPTLENAVLVRAVKMLGLMPAVALPEDDLKKIATYIWEEQFSPPCKHWEIGAIRAEKEGDVAHAKKDRKMLKRFCSE